MTWAKIESRRAEMATGAYAPSPEAIANTQKLLIWARDRYPAPDEATGGYWPTINLCWNELAVPMVIEVHDEHYELYQFRDGATEIAHLGCLADGSANLALIDKLASCFRA